mgnify:CR=1 FL=1
MSIKPQLLKLFLSGDEVVRFEPVGPEDVQAAKIESEYINHIALQKNDAFELFSGWIHDGLIQKNGEAKIVIEGSASKVPTRTFGTNENLSKQRMEDARKRLVEAVQARGSDPNKLMLEAVNHLVQGPRYQGDYQNTEKYGKFQFVRLKAR